MEEKEQTAEVELGCGVYGEATVFPVKVARGAKVSALQEAIFSKNRYKERYSFDASELTLYLARKNGEWLKDDRHVKAFLGASVSTEYEEMRPSWSLNDEKYFGESFQPRPKEIHVLVKLPGRTKPVLPQNRQLVVGDVHIPITQIMSLNPPALTAFWKALMNDRTEVKAGAMIELPKDTYLFGDDELGSRFYIRHCYPRLLKCCQQWIQDEDYRRIAILGNPGIGKSYFGFLLLHQLARAGATVVYESGNSKDRIVFSPDTVIRGSQQEFNGILDQPTTYYIVDAAKPTHYLVKTILLTLPRRSILHEFSKKKCRLCYMPVWSLEEILECRELMYADTPEDVVKDCFYRWGGIARYVLEHAKDEIQQEQLDKVLGMVNLVWLANACRNLDADDAEVAHHLLHYHANEQFDKENFSFASHYVQEEVYNRLYAQDKRKLLSFLAASNDADALAVLRTL